MEIKPHIDIPEKDYALLLSMLQHYLPGIQVWAFGSRVTLKSTPRSDLDLVALVKPEDNCNLADLKDAFDESDLSFRVDLLAWDTLPDNFKANIRQQHVIIQK